MKVVSIGLCLVMCLCTRVLARKGGYQPEMDGPPERPPQSEGGQEMPHGATEGRRGRKEYTLEGLQRQVIVWPRGCTFGVRKLGCYSNETETDEDLCKPLIVALQHVRELRSCGGAEVGIRPGR